jgi:ABC-type nickel/cobalt efflux system permease component RcnA
MAWNLGVGLSVFVIVVIVGFWMAWKRCRELRKDHKEESGEFTNSESRKVAEIALID